MYHYRNLYVLLVSSGISICKSRASYIFYVDEFPNVVEDVKMIDGMECIKVMITAIIAFIMLGVIIFAVTYEAEKFNMEEFNNCSIAYWKDEKVATAKISDEDGKNIYDIFSGQEMYRQSNVEYQVMIERKVL